MSLVTLIATNRFVSFVSDGRVVDGALIVDENYKKVNKVNNKIIFSLTGDYNASKILNDSLELFNQNDAQSFANSVFEAIGNGKLNKKVQILVGGLDQSNNIYYAGFDEGAEELVEVRPKLNDIRHALTGNDGAFQRSDLISKLINEHVNSYQEVTLEKMQQVQIEFNKEISKIDKSVNNNNYMEYIYKK